MKEITQTIYPLVSVKARSLATVYTMHLMVYINIYIYENFANHYSTVYIYIYMSHHIWRLHHIYLMSKEGGEKGERMVRSSDMYIGSVACNKTSSTINCWGMSCAKCSIAWPPTMIYRISSWNHLPLYKQNQHSSWPANLFHSFQQRNEEASASLPAKQQSSSRHTSWRNWKAFPPYYIYIYICLKQKKNIRSTTPIKRNNSFSTYIPGKNVSLFLSWEVYKPQTVNVYI